MLRKSFELKNTLLSPGLSKLEGLIDLKQGTVDSSILRLFLRFSLPLSSKSVFDRLLLSKNVELSERRGFACGFTRFFVTFLFSSSSFLFRSISRRLFARVPFFTGATIGGVGV